MQEKVTSYESKRLSYYVSLRPPSKCKVLDSNGELCYRDATNKPDFFHDPVELPKRLTAEEMRYLPRCIREYTALSLYQERLAKEMKETAFKMLTSFYHGG